MTRPEIDRPGGLQPRWRQTALALMLLGVSFSVGPSAGAQTPAELDKARSLFKEAVALSAAGNCLAAIPKLRAVARIKMTVQVAFNTAECEERTGKLVSSLGSYRLAASLAGGDAAGQDLATRVLDRITALQPRIPRLVIKRGKRVAGASIELDGIELGAAQIDAEIPVDPGAHTLVVKTAAKELSRDTLTLAETETKLFEVKF